VTPCMSLMMQNIPLLCLLRSQNQFEPLAWHPCRIAGERKNKALLCVGKISTTPKERNISTAVQRSTRWLSRRPRRVQSTPA